MSKHHKSSNRNVCRSLVLITQFGINMVVPIGMMTALGIWIDRRLDTSFWVVILFFAGAAAGGQNIYRMAKQIYNEPTERNAGTKHSGERNADKSDENNRSIEKKQ